ncbi:class I SAM-dependent methyltransferase [Synechococcus sp. PROS-U-1]|uniref:class I SAM-dependent methyltransferase n=1 Tax=Synechococcus sp. PROS-U-1 TaxID=1400866 RepID=UPI0016476A60|nr:class I SAM-dependent methyltransferase [Synechococcus sp. PROS-U-1]QNJ01754.1 cephalosporin hydroxylase family protein [Synechococcus sp. PROS-U-1]
MEALSQLRKSCSWPSIYYDCVDRLIKLTNAQVVLEIGVAYGLHAEHLLERFPALIYYGIDPFKAGYDPNDGFVRDVHMAYKDINEQISMDNLYKDVTKSINQNYPIRSCITRATLSECSNLFPKEFFDFIFIDGDHRYEAVKKDLNNSLALVKKNGVLAGDDYDWQDVAKAVDIFASEHDLKIDFINGENGHKIWYSKLN